MVFTDVPFPWILETHVRILVCGGMGYIGGHVCVELIERGHRVVIADNLCNSSVLALKRIETVARIPVEFECIDMRDRPGLDRLFAAGRFDAVVHLAGLKAVADSCARPLDYFDNNVGGTISLLQAMRDAGVRRLVFSSSATVYGAPDSVPVREDAPLHATNPYGCTKLAMEQLIADMEQSDPGFRAAVLRYFNPIGAHPSGLIGDDPRGVPENLMPNICQVAVGRRDRLRVYGDDYPTADGTGVRDYIHVMDLARAHADALKHLVETETNLTVNLGTGHGISVRELVDAFERASGRIIPCEFVARRAGDVAEVYADPALAQRLMGWHAEHDVDDMCRDAWRWQSMNPNGYATPLHLVGGEPPPRRPDPPAAGEPITAIAS
jgi:UDP-glucose 4-epimerase